MEGGIDEAKTENTPYGKGCIMTAETPAGTISAARLSRIALAAVNVNDATAQTRLRNAIRRCADAARAADALAETMLATWECAYQEVIARDGTPLRELVARGEWRTRDVLQRQAALCRLLAALKIKYLETP